jgi:hypothetical protein
MGLVEVHAGANRGGNEGPSPFPKLALPGNACQKYPPQKRNDVIGQAIHCLRLAFYSWRVAAALIWGNGVDRQKALGALRGENLESCLAEGTPASLVAAGMALDPDLGAHAWREARTFRSALDDARPMEPHERSE